MFHHCDFQPLAPLGGLGFLWPSWLLVSSLGRGLFIFWDLMSFAAGSCAPLAPPTLDPEPGLCSSFPSHSLFPTVGVLPAALFLLCSPRTPGRPGPGRPPSCLPPSPPPRPGGPVHPPPPPAPPLSSHDDPKLPPGPRHCSNHGHPRAPRRPTLFAEVRAFFFEEHPRPAGPRQTVRKYHIQPGYHLVACAPS